MTGQQPSRSFAEDMLRFQFATALEEMEASRQALDAAHRARAERLLLVLADTLDSFDRLLADGPGGDGESARYHESLRLIARQLETNMLDNGLELIGRVGETADPATHVVVETRPAPDTADDEVVEVMRRGCRFEGHVLRPARVVVAAALTTEQPATEPADTQTDAQGSNER